MQDMAEAAADIAEFIGDMDFDAFVVDTRTQNAVFFQQLTLIGDAAQRLSANLKATAATLPPTGRST
ncbi:MAG: hypothetical protein H7338_08690 [Candidatus Sericytochromatia bacterium]|nr:hypothetical protein [Candidatus Sericytochromatia bacterium]